MAEDQTKKREAELQGCLNKLIAGCAIGAAAVFVAGNIANIPHRLYNAGRSAVGLPKSDYERDVFSLEAHGDLGEIGYTTRGTVQETEAIKELVLRVPRTYIRLGGVVRMSDAIEYFEKIDHDGDKVLTSDEVFGRVHVPEYRPSGSLADCVGPYVDELPDIAQVNSNSRWF